MGQILELLKLIIPFIMEIIQILKGQSPETQASALEKASKAVAKECSGIGCAPKLKK